MSRTNKQGIAAKKAQQAKQAKRTKGAKRFEYPKRALSVEEGKELGVMWVQTNAKGNSYHWFLKWRKICYETKMRVDPDGYRFVRLPNWGTDYVSVGMSWWTRKKVIKSLKFKK